MTIACNIGWVAGTGDVNSEREGMHRMFPISQSSVVFRNCIPSPPISGAVFFYNFCFLFSPFDTLQKLPPLQLSGQGWQECSASMSRSNEQFGGGTVVRTSLTLSPRAIE